MESSDIFLASNQFGLDVFKILYEKQKSGNSFISPIVLASSVAALYMGASEDTRKRIAKALRLDNYVGEEHVLKLQSYLKALQTQCADHVTLSSGIKILLDKKWNCLDGFKHKIQQLPFTEMQSCDFQHDTDTLAQDLHRWLAQVSNGSISNDLKVENTDHDQSLSVISCAYFKGKWVHGFDAKNTQLLPFVVAPGHSEEVPMMCATGRYPYIKDNELRYSALELPYQGGRLGVVIILPDEYFGLEILLKNLNLEIISELLKNLYMADSALNLIVPKFEIKNTFQLATTLSSMGMEQAFSADKSNFSELANPCRGLRLHAVTQAAAIKVDEEGTVATAAPGSKGRPAKAGLSNILKVRVDHPFLYVIVDKADQNTFLFIGHINNPVLNA
ncbi:leukocyte elastase inhibitor C [Biomphalaria glabrata]|nr:leukocyte elastase inhibitor C [Biomphalaria glabrata]